MQEKITYLSEIIQALQLLNGMGSLKEIISIIEQRNKLIYIHTNDNWKANIRATIQRHCSFTKSYRGSENIFYPVYGLREGYWGLISMKKSDNSIADNYIMKRKLSAVENDSTLPDTEKKMLIKARIGQGIFRENLISRYGCCVITGIDDKRLLIASHIKPWRSSDNVERLSVENGLLLSPLYDKLFDIGLITFDDKMNMLASSELSSENANKVLTTHNYLKSIKLSNEFRRNMEYHRNVIFKK